ncbi:MAG: HAD family hydrolase [Firmicutes bacterium]|nr:HAD family hydrolase [Bacillota bacterium]
MIKGVIFDLDGTTLYTLPDLHHSVNLAMEHFGFPLKTAEEVKAGVGNGFQKLIDAIVPEGTDEAKRKEVGIYYRDTYRENCCIETVPYEGMNEVLKTLQEKGIQLAINSNKSDNTTKILISRCFPDIRFTEVMGAREGVPRKPDPTGVLQILDLMQISREEALYVGDSDTDMLTAKNAGIKAVGCLWGYRDLKTLQENGADILLSRPEELLEHLNN